MIWALKAVVLLLLLPLAVAPAYPSFLAMTKPPTQERLSRAWLPTGTTSSQKPNPEDLTSTQAPGTPCLTPTPADISTEPISPGPGTSAIPGSVVPAVKDHKVAANGALPASMQLHMEFVLKIRNQAQFSQCLASLSDPTSSNYGHFLNGTTLAPYLPTPGQKSTVARFLTAYGFNVTDGFSPLVLNVVGSVDRAERIFGVHVGVYGSGNSSFYAIDSDPTLPQNLAAVTTGILGLDNYATIGPADQNQCSGPYCPQGIQVGYSLSSLYTSGKDGTGVKVAMTDVPGDPNIQTAINTYSTQYGLPATTLTLRYPECPDPLTSCYSLSQYDRGWAAETAMDVEAVHTVAPGAGIVLVYASDLLGAIGYIASNHLATIVSNSWIYTCNSGNCNDKQLPSSLVSSVDSNLAAYAAQGLTILFASGDDGAKPDLTNLGTQFPASDPNVLSVGATNLALSGSCSNTCSGYGSETGASISGGGISGFFAEPSWQLSTIGAKSGSCPSGNCRAVPDVSMLGYVPSFWVYSTYTNNCAAGGVGAGWFGCAGTSLSTPLWAGFLAIAQQMRGSSFGNIAPNVYHIANSAQYSSTFHDVTSGSNNGYSASAGWDPVTGWGSPIASSLAPALAQVKILLTPTSGGIGASVSITGSNFATTDTACSISSTPTGLISSQNCTPSTGSISASFIVATGVLAQQYTVTVTGSPINDQASATFTVTSTQVTVNSNPTGSGFIVVDSAAVTTPQINTWVTGSTHTLAASSPVAGSTGVQYVWTSWSDGLAQSHSITVPSSTTTYTANFKTQYRLTIDLNPSAGGSTTPAVGSYWYDSGAAQSVTATPASGYSFSYWSLDGTNVGGIAMYVVTMNAPHTLTGFLRSLSTISIPSSTSITLGSSVSISGTITPTHTPPGILAGNNVMLSYSLDSGATWSIFITTQTDSAGSYSVVWYLPYPGTYQLKSSWGGNANYQGATSTTATLTVTGIAPAPISMLVIGSNSAGRGSSTSFNVLVTNPGSTTQTTLYLEITGPGGYYYFDTKQISVTSSSTGRFQFDWQIPSTLSAGTYVVTVGLIPGKPTAIAQTQLTLT